MCGLTHSRHTTCHTQDLIACSPLPLSAHALCRPQGHYQGHQWPKPHLHQVSAIHLLGGWCGHLRTSVHHNTHHTRSSQTPHTSPACGLKAQSPSIHVVGVHRTASFSVRTRARVCARLPCGRGCCGGGRHGGIGDVKGARMASPLADLLQACPECGWCWWGGWALVALRVPRVGRCFAPRWRLRGVKAQRCITDWKSQSTSAPVCTLEECHIACTLARFQPLQVLGS